MQVRVAETARRHLLETVARLRDDDPDVAAAFLNRFEKRLAALVKDPDEGSEVGPPRSSDDEGLRIYYRIRRDTLWIIGVWSPVGSV